MATLAMLQVELQDFKTPKSEIFFHRIMALPTLFSGIRCRLLNGFSCFLPSSIRPTPRKVQLIWITFDLILTSDFPEASGK